MQMVHGSIQDCFNLKQPEKVDVQYTEDYTHSHPVFIPSPLYPLCISSDVP